MSEPSSRSMEKARDLLKPWWGAINAARAVALALDAARAEGAREALAKAVLRDVSMVRAEERERCARIAEDAKNSGEGEYCRGRDTAAKDIADLIRKSEEKTTCQ